MRLAVNYSQPAADLLALGQIDIDLFKCCPDPDWLPLAAEARRLKPVYLHYTLHTGIQQIENAPWDQYLKLQVETQTRFINLHLLSPTPLLDGRPGVPQIASVLTELRPLVSVLGAEQIIIENLPHPMNGPHGQHPISDPLAICDIIEASGCGFLLDLPHAVLAARNLGIDPKQYLSSLPVKSIRELHLTGIALHDGQLEDHFALSESDWNLAEWAFEQIHAGYWSTPDIVAFEYGGFGPAFAFRNDPDVLLDQLPRLRRLMLKSVPA